MSCFLCGHEKKGSHHLGCAVLLKPDLTLDEAVEAGLMPRPVLADVPPVPNVEILREGSMTTVPEAVANACAVQGCDNPKIDHPRAKYCEGHKDPKNRKE